MILNFRDWEIVCEGDRYLTLTEFLKRHADHEIIVIEEAIHTWATDADELRARCGRGASVEYLGKESPHWDGTDGLFFEITPKPKKRRRQPIHVVVYPI